MRSRGTPWVALLLALACLSPAGAVRAAGWSRGSDEKGAEDRWEHEYTISPRTAEHLVKAREHLLAERYDKAQKELDKLRIDRLNPLEQAQAYRIYAFVAHGRGDLGKAREALEKALASGGLPAPEAADVRYQIAQLWMQDEHWSEAAKTLEQWFQEVGDPNASAYYTLAVVYYQLEDYDKSLPAIQKAVSMSKEPRASWLELLLGLRLLRKEYEQAIPILETLVRLDPKKDYWVTLSKLYGALGDYDEALVHLQLLYAQGLMTEDSEYRQLAQLLQHLDLPYRAADVLRKGLAEGVVKGDVEAWEMLGNSWIAAREYDAAVPPLAKAAALSDDGELYVRLAQVHLQREKWGKASAALEKALQKGGLRDPASAQLLMGIAIYSQKQPEKARPWFARASRHETTRTEARAWLDYIDRQQPAS